MQPHPYIWLPIKKDELLSSYIARLIAFVGCPVNTFCREILGDSKTLRKDIDLYKNEELHQRLSIYGLKHYPPLSEYTRWMRCIDHYFHQSPDVMSVNIIGTARKKFGLMYCPICLADNECFKLQWRISVLPYCLKHNCILMDRCPNCSEPILLNKTTPLLGDFRHCQSCWQPLIIESSSLYEYQRPFLIALENSIRTGWFEYGGQSLYAPLFFHGFWRILYSFYGVKGRQKKTFNKLCSYYNVPMFTLSKSGRNTGFIDETPVNKIQILYIISKMLTDWPNNMVRACEHAGITRITLDLTKIGLPYWLANIANQELNKDWYKINLVEFECALKYMKKNNIEITKAGLARVLGLDKSKKMNQFEEKLFEEYQ